MAVNLRDERKRAGLTQEQLAERSGIAQDVISSLETGRVQNPTWRTVSRLADALQIQPSDLFSEPKNDAA